MNNKSYIFKKNIPGTFTLVLNSENMLTTPKEFVFSDKIDSLLIPNTFALGMFITQAAMHQFEIGCFTIEDFESLQKEGAELGICAKIPMPEVAKKSDLVELLRSNNTTKTKDFLKKATPIELNSFVILANENIDALNQGMLQIIENTCGVSLRNE